jgi:hypothetical protein
MEPIEFEKLSLNEKARHVWLSGEYLETITYGEFLVTIYYLNKELNHRFAEVFYNPKTDTIEKISLVDKIDLHKFITCININELSLYAAGHK